MAAPEAISVSQALADAKACLHALPTMVVAGEVTGFRGPNARSGHCYFQVKDDAATMDAIVWRGVYASAGFELRDGLQVLLHGGFDVYAGNGRMSFVAKKIEVAGEGLLRQQVAELARKLEREGLMDEARKRKVPRFCSRVAVVTSLSGSVIDDVKRTLARRNPLVELLVAGCQVQGPGAPATIMRALGVAAAARPDAILLVRGGGSFEDLMTFNDETLARFVASCPVPVITGIGHEPDTSICDMVADRRCSTPTAAAESVAPALDELAQVTESRHLRLANAMDRMLELRREETEALGKRAGLASLRTVERGQATLDALASRATAAITSDVSRRRLALEALASRRCLTNPYAMVEDRATTLELTAERLHASLPRLVARRGEQVGMLGMRLDAAGGRIAVGERALVDPLDARLRRAGKRLFEPYEALLARHAASLDALSPLKVIGRGYAIAKDADGHVVTTVAALAPQDAVTVLVGDGEFDATVTQVRCAQKED